MLFAETLSVGETNVLTAYVHCLSEVQKSLVKLCFTWAYCKENEKKSPDNVVLYDSIEKPHNPMVNAGAILVLSLLLNLSEVDMSLAEKFDWVMNYFKVSPVLDPLTTHVLCLFGFFSVREWSPLTLRCLHVILSSPPPDGGA